MDTKTSNSHIHAVVVDCSLAMLTISGTETIRNGYRNGDSILIDTVHNVFAVADATQRFPKASEVLLSNIVHHLHTVPQSVDEWKQFLDGIFSMQEYHLKTTLSLVGLQKGNIPIAFIAHGGDSTLQLYNKASLEKYYSTQVDMHFAGRSKGMQRVEQVKIEKPTRIVIYTDGFNECVKLCKLDTAYIIHAQMTEVCEYIMNAVKQLREVEYDDASILLLDVPEIFSFKTSTILISNGACYEVMEEIISHQEVQGKKVCM